MIKRLNWAVMSSLGALANENVTDFYSWLAIQLFIGLPVGLLLLIGTRNNEKETEEEINPTVEPTPSLYRIQERKYSSNILEKKIDGTWVPYIAPLSVKKKEGDQITNDIKNFLENF